MTERAGWRRFGTILMMARGDYHATIAPQRVPDLRDVHLLVFKGREVIQTGWYADEREAQEVAEAKLKTLEEK
jgi:hypothetical protein